MSRTRSEVTNKVSHKNYLHGRVWTRRVTQAFARILVQAPILVVAALLLTLCAQAQFGTQAVGVATGAGLSIKPANRGVLR